MIGNIIVAVACNLLVLVLLINGIITARHNGVRVTLVKLFMSVGAVVGAFFLTPLLSKALYAVEKVPELLSYIGTSVGTVNSCMFLALFLVGYGITLIVCSIVKHALIKSLKEKKVNKAKVKRAKSINPKAEKAVEKAEWKALKAKYKSGRKWYKKLISGLLGIVIAAGFAFTLLIPYGYIAKDINNKSEGQKQYLVDGYDYTLNGLIPDEFYDWAVHAQK